MCEDMCVRARCVFGAGLVQHRDLSDSAAVGEERPPLFAVAQVTLSLPLPEALLQLCLHLNVTHTVNRISRNLPEPPQVFPLTGHLLSPQLPLKSDQIIRKIGFKCVRTCVNHRMNLVS